MKKTLFILGFILIFTGIAQAQDYKIFKGDTINRTDAKGQKQGEWKRYYDNDQLFSKTTFKNGKPVSPTLTYYKSGEKQGELIHSSDGKTAHMISYWPNGKMKAKGKYINQEKDSSWTYYNEKEIVTAVEIYKAGKATGLWKVFYNDGKISEETNYSNGLKNGPFKRYFPSGIPNMSGTYKNDRIDGQIINFHLNGKPYIKGTFQDGLKQGEWIYMNDSGVKDSVEFYNDGVLQEK